ncbi:unnamed protein product [Amoebophrya sp. A25]|nr:unnamed protein product [Amoebophrya sp. A25]|eukprot:GSA25T00008078001.1
MTTRSWQFLCVLCACTSALDQGQRKKRVAASEVSDKEFVGQLEQERKKKIDEQEGKDQAAMANDSLFKAHDDKCADLQTEAAEPEGGSRAAAAKQIVDGLVDRFYGKEKPAAKQAMKALGGAGDAAPTQALAVGLCKARREMNTACTQEDKNGAAQEKLRDEKMSQIYEGVSRAGPVAGWLWVMAMSADYYWGGYWLGQRNDLRAALYSPCGTDAAAGVGAFPSRIQSEMNNFADDDSAAALVPNFIVFSDHDDTLESSDPKNGGISGIDRSLKNPHTVYPNAVLAHKLLMTESGLEGNNLIKGTTLQAAAGKELPSTWFLSLLTARAPELVSRNGSPVNELHGLAESRKPTKESPTPTPVAVLPGAPLQGEGTTNLLLGLLAAGKRTTPGSEATLDVAKEALDAVQARKVEVLQQFNMFLPSNSKRIFIGDDGQADAKAAAEMLKKGMISYAAIKRVWFGGNFIQQDPFVWLQASIAEGKLPNFFYFDHYAPVYQGSADWGLFNSEFAKTVVEDQFGTGKTSKTEARWWSQEDKGREVIAFYERICTAKTGVRYLCSYKNNSCDRNEGLVVDTKNLPTLVGHLLAADVLPEEAKSTNEPVQLTNDLCETDRDRQSVSTWTLGKGKTKLDYSAVTVFSNSDADVKATDASGTEEISIKKITVVRIPTDAKPAAADASPVA